MPPKLTNLPVPIRTPRLVLKPASIQYAQDLLEAKHETIQSLQPWMMWAQNEPKLEDEEAFLLKSEKFLQEPGEINFAVFDKNDRFIAMSGFNPFNNWQTPIAHIGYWCRQSEQSKGYVTEWCNALTRYAFAVMGLKKVSIRVDQENHASVAVAERLGFTLEFSEKYGVVKPNDDTMRICQNYSCFNPKILPPLDVVWGE